MISERTSCRFGFTLVELLVVIMTVGVIAALLLPAIQAAREAARRTQCSNNLKQIALGCLRHEQAHGFFPSGGWGTWWVGEPLRPFGSKQPGGWLYSVLPYIDLQQLHDRGVIDGIDARADRPGIKACIETPVSVFICPSRRSAIALPYYDNMKLGGVNNSFVNLNSKSVPTKAGYTDYAASGGDTLWAGPFAGAGCSAPCTCTTKDRVSDATWIAEHVAGAYTSGVVYLRSEVTALDITDGTTNTYLAGEKYLNPEDYYSGVGVMDRKPWNSGWNFDTVRWSGQGSNGDINAQMPADSGDPTANNGQGSWIGTKGITYDKNGVLYGIIWCFQPAQDTAGDDTHFTAFGSAHANSFAMAFCDGSVHWMSYGIDLATHHYLGNIADGAQVDGKRSGR